MLHHSVSFASPLTPAAARSSTIVWLTAIGYRLTTMPFLTSIDASRGSVMGNIASLNPKAWSVRTRISFEPEEEHCRVNLEIWVSTIGQIVTNADIAFWSDEVTQIVEAACGGKPEVADFTRRGKAAAVGNAWRAGIFTFFSLGSLAIAAIFIGRPVAVVLFPTVAGLLSWLAFRAPRVLTPVLPETNGQGAKTA